MVASGMKKLKYPFLTALLCSPLGLQANPLEDKGRPVAQTAALPAAETVAAMTVPEGFSVNVFAAEPDVVQPIAFTMDDRGRLWVLECTNYPNSPGEPKDKILILEDTNGDGKSDKRTVFYDRLTFASGIALGHGGVWVGAPPNLLFFPRRDDQDVFDREPEIVLDGWGAQDTHETLNNFIWGPDGWLYGTHGIFTHSKVGKPGTPEDQRVGINAGIFRVHPKTRQIELYAEGGSNQWGVDFNDHGQAYFAACVISHMWQGIQGARYSRQAGSHFNPHTYEDIRTIAGFAYEKRAYCGAMIYLGGSWPESYRNTFFFNDIHMNRLRNERHEPDGSGTRAVKHGDFLVSGDPWFRGLSPQYGPDGSVFLSDWYDRVPCHQQREFTDRSNGRLYRITYGKPDTVKINLQAASNEELVAHQLNPNDWHVRHARRILAERGPNPEVHTALKKILDGNPDPTRKLRALWALHVTEGLDEKTSLSQLAGNDEHLRSWAIQLAAENGRPSAHQLAEFAKLAASDPSPMVRRYLASAAGRLPLDQRWPILNALASRGEDLSDPNIRQLIWYAMEPAAAADFDKAVAVLAISGMPKLNHHIGRRLASTGDLSALNKLVASIASLEDHESISHILGGMKTGLEGRADLVPPIGWQELHDQLQAHENESIRNEARTLSACFGGETAIQELRDALADGKNPVENRRTAMATLLAINDAGTRDQLLELLTSENPLRKDALRGLANYAQPGIHQAILAVYPQLIASEKAAAIGTLITRKEGITSLIAAVESKVVALADLTAPFVSQMANLADPADSEWIARNWGAVRKSSAEKVAEIAHFKKFLGTDAILAADPGNGRVLFGQRCAACHRMHGEGNLIGPELPGNFKDLDYMLSNLIDPGAMIGKDYQQAFVEKTDGQVLSGVIVSDGDRNVTLRTLAGDRIISKSEIRKTTVSDQSLMPEGLLAGLEEPEIRDLFLYLRQAAQVPLPGESE